MRRLIILIAFAVLPLPELFSQTKGIKLPIEYHRGHIYFDASINGKQLKCVFDTGADFLYIDSLYYNNSGLHFPKMGIALLPGAGNTPQKVRLIVETVNLACGEKIFPFTTVPIFSLKTILGDVADALVGTQHFRDKVITFDFIKNEMGIHDDINEVNLEGFTKHKYEFVSNRIYVPITLKIKDGLTVNGKVAFDMGSGGGLTITSGAAKQFFLDSKTDKKLYFYTKYGGVGGDSEDVTIESDNIDFFGYKVDLPFASYSLDKGGALSTANHIGLLGNEVFDRFDILIDFKNKYLYLKPNSEFSRPSSSKTTGFSYVVRNKTYGALIVTGFYRNSAAEKLGMKIDDQITEINGQRVSETHYKDIDDLIHKSKTLKMKVRRGNEHFQYEIPIVTMKELIN